MDHDSPVFQIYQCQQPTCRFRFSTLSGDPKAGRCPRCGKATESLGVPYVNDQARLCGDEKRPVEALLDNIRSTFNVGAMFRTADGAGLRHLSLCGITPLPDNPKIIKTALGAESAVSWSYHPNALDAALVKRQQGAHLWALESCSRSVSIFEAVKVFPLDPVILVVGNELTGVDPGLLEICEQVVAIPMQGYKHSLNVAIAFGVAAYTLQFG